MANDEDLYDQDPRPDSVAPDKNNSSDDEEKDYQSFLAPKSAFAGKDISVGAVHRVKFDRILESEIEMHCVKGKGKDEPESEDNATEEQSELYQ